MPAPWPCPPVCISIGAKEAGWRRVWEESLTGSVGGLGGESWDGHGHTHRFWEGLKQYLGSTLAQKTCHELIINCIMELTVSFLHSQCFAFPKFIWLRTTKL